jgi:hypothetical protein
MITCGAPSNWFVDVVSPPDSKGQATRQVLACRLQSPKSASGVMKLLSKEFPFDEYSLSHLKRIQKDGKGVLMVLVGPADVWESTPHETRQMWMESYLMDEPVLVVVPAYPAASRKEVDSRFDQLCALGKI